MRKVIVAAVTAAALGTLGLTATAQAQSAARPAATVKVSARVVLGIPASVLLKTSSSTTKCKWKTPGGVPDAVTVGKNAAVDNNCELEIEGVWQKAGSDTITDSATQGSTTTKYKVKVTILSAPCENDATGVGSDTITPLTDQLANDYNNTLAPESTCPSTASPAKTREYSWDAINPVTGAIDDTIAEKADCPSIERPDGSSNGIKQLATFAASTSGPYCTNFARSSRARESTDPIYGAGGIAFTALAEDAVTWSVPAVNTFAPASLTPAQLTDIWSCAVPEANNGTGMNQWGDLNPALTGSAATTPIAPFLPESGSGTLSFWESAIGVSTPGPCVSNDGNLLEENEGDNSVLDNTGAIFIYSVGDDIAQTEHSATCVTAGCGPNADGVVCVKVPGLNQFGCNVSGVGTAQGAEQLGEISGEAPITGSGTSESINPSFPSTFDRTLYDVVPYDPNTTDHIPGDESGAVGGVDLESIFGASGFDCTSATAQKDITDYGFVNIPDCGSTS
jgi:ABC-type phosphate transport system substrate-binding protein